MTAKSMTAQEISNLEQNKKQFREQLTLYRRPFETISVFIDAACSLSMTAMKYVVTHPIFLCLFVPLLVLWLVFDRIPGPYSAAINDFEFAMEYIVWWTGLGILSSIGLGSGLQSGVLFLFPHIIRVCLAAQSCKTMDFESYGDIWFRSTEHMFQCPDQLTEASTPVTFFNIWKRVILACFLQSLGTAIGEIPPYWMTRSARLAAINAGEDQGDEVPEELESCSQTGLVNTLKSIMVWFLRTYGFHGVLLMASYPNIAFDLCGVCCGHFLMPFWTFFLATFFGKAIIRNSYQSVIYVALCRFA